MKRPLDPSIIARRDELKSTLSPEVYQAVVEPYMLIISGLPGEDTVSALALYRQVSEQGGDPIAVLAALVELRERET